MAKLNKTKVGTIIQLKRLGLSSRLIARQLEVSPRRVDQVWQYFRCTGKLLEIRQQWRKEREFTCEDIALVLHIQQRQGYGVRLVGKLLRRKYMGWKRKLIKE